MSETKQPFSRVTTLIQGLLRKLSSPESPSAFSDVSLLSGPQGEEAFQGTTIPKALVDFLRAMDEKLSIILSHIGKGALSQDFPITAEVVAVSGAEISFYADWDFTEGDYYEVALVLNKLPLHLASAIGRVAPAQGFPDAPNATRKLWTLCFTRIREQDLEAIVQFVFQEERQRIREKRWE